MSAVHLILVMKPIDNMIFPLISILMEILICGNSSPRCLIELNIDVKHSK
jgi:hypothetical protein